MIDGACRRRFRFFGAMTERSRAIRYSGFVSHKYFPSLVFSEFVPVSDFLRPKTCRVFKYFVGIKTLEMRYSMANSWKEAETLLPSQTWSFRILRVLRSRDKKTLGKNNDVGASRKQKSSLLD